MNVCAFFVLDLWEKYNIHNLKNSTQSLGESIPQIWFMVKICKVCNILFEYDPIL